MEEPSTPSSTYSSAPVSETGQPSPPPRNSMEDADSSVTRKRPRLDSGERAHQNITSPYFTIAGEAEKKDLGSSISTPSASPTPCVTEHAPPTLENCAELGTRAASKVTLNIRDPLHPHTIAPDSSEQNVEKIHQSTMNTQKMAPVPSRSLELKSTNNKGSNPGDCPNIEETDPADAIDSLEAGAAWQEPAGWNSFSWQQQHVAKFPLFQHNPMTDQVSDLNGLVEEIIIAQDPGLLSNYRKTIAHWIDEYLARTRYAPQDWPSLVSRDQTFWLSLPAIHRLVTDDAICSSLRPVNASGYLASQHITEFLVAFTTLAARMVSCDCAALRTSKSEDPCKRLLSAGYCVGLRRMLTCKQELLSWIESLERMGLNLMLQLSVFACDTEASPSFLSELTKVVSLLLCQTHLDPDLATFVQRALALPMELFSLCQVPLQPQRTTEIEAVRMSFHKFFQTIDSALRSAIKKQLSSLTSETMSCISKHLPSFINRSNDLVCSIFTRYDLDVKEELSSLTEADMTYLAEAVWRIDLYEKCIREGRMEIRIFGLDALQASLVDVYRRYIDSRQSSDKRHPIVECVSDRLLRNRVVEYIFSVDSHPQIISRSANVIGFVAVSGHWTDEQTFSIWRTIHRAEDLRASDTIIELLPHVTKYLECKDILLFIKCMQDTTISRLDPKALQTLLVFCKQAVEKTDAPNETFIVLVNAFAHILRQASADPALSVTRKYEIWQEILKAFNQLAAIDWPPAARWPIYQACFQDLNSKSLQTSGSCAIIRQLLVRYGDQDIKRLSGEYDVTKLVVSDFARLGELSLATGTNFNEFMLPVEDRLIILEIIILRLPDTLTAGVTRQLWSSMFAKNAIGACARDASWDLLARVATQCNSANMFMDQCITEHIPSLGAEHYSRSALTFAKCVSDYVHRTISKDDEESSDRPSSMASNDFLWQLASAANEDYISTKACQALLECGQDLSQDLSGVGTEMELIERSISQVVDFGIQLSRSPGQHTQEPDALTLRRRFERTFKMLTYFVGAVQNKSPVSPSSRSESQASQNSHVSERIVVQYSTNDRGVASPVKSIELNDQTTLAELLGRLRIRTGLSKFNAIIGGQRLDQDKQATVTLGSLRPHQKGVLILHRIPGSNILREGSSRNISRQIEDIVLHHFDELYPLLGTETLVADHILNFLSEHGTRDDIVTLVCGDWKDQDQVLPLGSPHRAIYALRAIAAKQKTRLEDGIIEYDFMQRSLRIMTRALCALNLRDVPKTAFRPSWLPLEIMLCMLQLLKEPVPPTVSKTYFDDPDAIVSRVHDLAQFQDSEQNREGFDLEQTCFAILLEVSRLDQCAWRAFSTCERSKVLFSGLILGSRDASRRFAVQQNVAGVLASLSASHSVPAARDKEQVLSDSSEATLEPSSFAVFFWQIACGMIPAAMSDLAAHSQQFFALALTLFNTLTDQALDIQNLQNDVQEWSTLLQRYKPREVSIHGSIDWPVAGLGELLHQALMVYKRKRSTYTLGPYTFRSIFESTLFPPVLDGKARMTGNTNAPVLASDTRNIVYKLLLRITMDSGDFNQAFESLNGVFCDPISQAHSGIWNFDRSKYLRAPAGYPGLENLSNTCYLNSLLTQLFMNPRFREFILGCEIIDVRSQTLILAMQRLFASLQHGWQKYVHTKELADAVETYDGPLDPTLQMDADEAFNLLFDRLESQLHDSRDREAFRKLYGGQLIQQIKSKECDHVSERFEPVTAIQCDIQGKRNLLQSLQAYIEGETMEGDNKYKCSKCDRYVNAVKRACLKDVPDNLIFHLKRFDFDLMTGMRNKVNDFFSFPEVIDMAPYTVEYLERQSACVSPDIFELVGVLVHNGSAEVGHYYSYIRERANDMRAWVEFNDTDVSPFDFAALNEQCFGGQPETGYSQSFPKTWNAYMLFYQRRESLTADQEHFMRNQSMSPIKVPMDEQLAAEIATSNESLAKVYNLFGQEHATFVKDLFAAFVRIRERRCSEDHRVEDSAIHCAWVHLERVFAKDCKRYGAHATVDFLRAMLDACPRCCSTVIDSLVGEDMVRMRGLLLRLPDADLRTRIGEVLLHALKQLKIQDPAAYGTAELYEDENLNVFETGKFALTAIRFYELLDVAPLNFKSWLEFYTLIHELANLGTVERSYMHRIGFLQHTLKTLSIETQHEWTQRYQETHHNYIRLIEKRSYNLAGLVKLIVTLLQDLQVGLDDHNPNEAESFLATSSSLTLEEKHLIMTKLKPEGGERRVPWVLERIAASFDPSFMGLSLDYLTRFLLKHENSFKLETSIVDLICHGIVKNPAELATPYLQIAAEFVSSSNSPRLIELVATCVVDGTKTIGDSGGAEHLQFFRRMLQTHNSTAYPDHPSEIILANIKLSYIWGMSLLEYPDLEVTDRCAQLLRLALFDPTPGYEHDEELNRTKSDAAGRFWSVISNRVQRYVRDGRSLDESRRPLLHFCELCLFHQAASADVSTEAEADAISHYKALIAQANDLVVTLDDGASNGFDSDDLTDVSSTYGSPEAVKVS